MPRQVVEAAAYWLSVTFKGGLAAVGVFLMVASAFTPRPAPPRVVPGALRALALEAPRIAHPGQGAPRPRPAPASSSPPGAVPPPGAGFSCQAALAYLSQYAAPGFVAWCPHYAGGHQATTMCDDAPQCVPGTEFIWIADPCPAAYMNEASNSWVLIGKSEAPVDPYGYCGEPGDPYGSQ